MRRFWPRAAARSSSARAALCAHAVSSRAAVLLRGGVPAGRVLSALLDELEGEAAAAETDELRGVVARVAAGSTTAQALAAAVGAEWRVLAAAWAVSEQGGAPLAPALERIAASLRGLDELRDRRSVLLAGPKATIRLVAALPALAAAFGSLLGFAPFSVLFSPSGLLLLVLGLVLLGTGVHWANTMTRRVERDDRIGGLELILVSIALAGGRPPDAAILQVADCAADAEAEWIDFDALRREGVVRVVLDGAAAVGAPAGPLLLAEAGGAQARARAELERAAERLGVRVMIPLGVCVLPSFVVLGVLPVLISMLGGLELG